LKTVIGLVVFLAIAAGAGYWYYFIHPRYDADQFIELAEKFDEVMDDYLEGEIGYRLLNIKAVTEETEYWADLAEILEEYTGDCSGVEEAIEERFNEFKATRRLRIPILRDTFEAMDARAGQDEFNSFAETATGHKIKKEKVSYYKTENEEATTQIIELVQEGAEILVEVLEEFCSSCPVESDILNQTLGYVKTPRLRSE